MMRHARMATAALLATVTAATLSSVPAAPAAAETTTCLAAAGGWKAIDLGTFGADYAATAEAINNSRQVVFRTREAYPRPDRALVWTDGQVTELGALGKYGAAANDIDEQGRVVGSSTASDVRSHGVLWENGTVHDLGRPNPNAISRRVVVGAKFEGGRSAFVWRAGISSGLGAQPLSEAVAVNEAGQIAGNHKIRGDFPSPYERTDHAFVWQNGAVRDLGTLGGNWSQAAAINDRGQVVGLSATASNGVFQDGFIWSPESGMKKLNVHASSGQAYPASINDSGMIVGDYSCSNPYGIGALAVWESADQVPTALALPPGFGEKLNADPWLTDINDRGDIVGNARGADNKFHAILWQRI